MCDLQVAWLVLSVVCPGLKVPAEVTACTVGVMDQSIKPHGFAAPKKSCLCF